MTYTVFIGTLNPTHFTSPVKISCTCVPTLFTVIKQRAVDGSKQLMLHKWVWHLKNLHQNCQRFFFFGGGGNLPHKKEDRLNQKTSN